MALVILCFPACQLALGPLRLAILNWLDRSATSIRSTSCCRSAPETTGRRDPGRDACGSVGYHSETCEEDHKKSEVHQAFLPCRGRAEENAVS